MWIKYLTANKKLIDVHRRLENTISLRHSIVVDPNKLFENNDPALFFTASPVIKLQRKCSDVDNNIPAEPVGEWDDLTHCDYKLFKLSLDPLHNLWSNVILNRFLSNSQPAKVLHISLDESATGTFKLLSSLPEKFNMFGDVYIEINDRTDTISNTSQARRLIDLLPSLEQNPNIITVEYFKTLTGFNRGWSLTISEPNSRPFYFWDV